MNPMWKHAVTFPKPRLVGGGGALEGSRLGSSAADGKGILMTAVQVRFSSLLEKVGKRESKGHR